jgi:cytoskeleton protein RodZ
MLELGRILREKRIEGGLDIGDIARQTRIRDYYLRAIEDGKYQTIPKAYYKGYVKIYATLLGLDARLLLAMYDQSLCPPCSQQPIPLASAPPEVLPTA